MRWLRASLGLVLALAGATTGHAQDLDKLSADFENPLANVARLAFNGASIFDEGRFQRTGYVLDIRPSVPIRFTSDMSVLFRADVPLADQPFGRLARVRGFGDTLLQAIAVPRSQGGLSWGVGGALQLPTRSEVALDDGMYGAGLVGTVVQSSGPWLFGATVSQLWSIGHPDRTETPFNTMLLQPFATYRFGAGWSANFSPQLLVDWLAPSGQQLRTPLAATLTKVFVVANQPMAISAGATYVPVRPDNASDWNLRASYTLIFPVN